MLLNILSTFKLYFTANWKEDGVSRIVCIFSLMQVVIPKFLFYSLI